MHINLTHVEQSVARLIDPQQEAVVVSAHHPLSRHKGIAAALWKARRTRSEPALEHAEGKGARAARAARGARGAQGVRVVRGTGARGHALCVDGALRHGAPPRALRSLRRARLPPCLLCPAPKPVIPPPPPPSQRAWATTPSATRLWTRTC